MSLLGARRAAEELARALDGGAGEPGSGTASLAGLGQRLRVAGAELDQLVTPREDFRAALRTRLVAVATVQPATAAPAAGGVLERLGGRGQKAAGVAAGALASVVAVSGVAVASTQSLPGDPFYGVKRTVEGLQLSLAGDAAAEGDRHLEFAATRLDEVRALMLGRGVELSDVTFPPAADTDWDRVRETLADMDRETRRGSTLLTQAWSETRDAQALRLLEEFTAAQSAELQQLLPILAAARAEAEASLGLVSQLAATASEMRGLGSCTEQCASGGGSSGGSGSDCDCGGQAPSSPRPSSTPGPTSSGSPAPAPVDPAPTTGAPAPGPATTSPEQPPASPSPPPRLLPTLPFPTQLPTELPTVSPAPGSGLPSLPLPSLKLPELDDLLPGDPADLLPG